jgi:hypothetical protein
MLQMGIPVVVPFENVGGLYAPTKVAAILKSRRKAAPTSINFPQTVPLPEFLAML